MTQRIDDGEQVPQVSSIRAEIVPDEVAMAHAAIGAPASGLVEIVAPRGKR